MKHRKRIRLLVSILLVLAISATYFSCSTDEDFVRHEHREGNKLEVKTFDELRNHPAFQASLARIKIKKQKGDLSRSEFEDQYGFTIVEDMVKVVTDSLGNVTYTLEIIPDVKTDEKLLNLVLKEQPQDEVLAWIIKYNSLSTEKKTEEQIKDAGIAEVKAITADEVRIAGPSISMTIVVMHCIASANSSQYCGGDVNNDNWTSACSSHYTFWIPWSEYYSDPYNTGGSSGSDGSSGDGFGGSVGTSPVKQDPVVLRLNELTNHPQVKPKLDELKTKFGSDIEHGYEFLISEIGTGYEPSLPLPSDEDGVYFPDAQHNSILRTHVHYGTQPFQGKNVVPSAEDVFLFMKFYKQVADFDANKAKDVVSIIMHQTGYNAMVVKDPQRIMTVYNNYINPNMIHQASGLPYYEWFNYRYNELMQKAYASCGGCNFTGLNASLEKYFRIFLSEIGGIAWYYAMPTPASNPNYVWYAY